MPLPRNRRGHDSWGRHYWQFNKSLGLPHNVDRSSLDETMLEKVARKENLVKALIEEGKQYGEIKDFILKG